MLCRRYACGYCMTARVTDSSSLHDPEAELFDGSFLVQGVPVRQTVVAQSDQLLPRAPKTQIQTHANTHRKRSHEPSTLPTPFNHSIHFSSTQFNFLQLISTHFNSFQLNSLHFASIEFNSTQFNSIQSNQFSSITFNSIQLLRDNTTMKTNAVEGVGGGGGF